MLIDVNVDVLVAGGGASGLVAAMAAADGGAKVLLIERAAELGGTTALGGGRVWIPANHCAENSGDTVAAARTYLHGLFPARYAYMTEAFLASAPAMARFAEARSPPARPTRTTIRPGPAPGSAAAAWTCGPRT